MTEAEWTLCNDPDRMLTALRGKASERKLRLFGVACCRRIWHLFTEKRSRLAVDVAERYADELVGDEELDSACAEAIKGVDVHSMLNEEASLLRAPAWAATRPEKFHAILFFQDLFSAEWFAGRTAADAREALAFALGKGKRTREAKKRSGQERDQQAALLRDLFGTSLFRPVEVEDGLRTWKEHTVLKLAQGIYEENAFERMPILADALEEAGCDNQDILSHCRQRTVHVRGCWVVDAILRQC